jgi:hypothetical protein
VARVTVGSFRNENGIFKWDIYSRTKTAYLTYVTGGGRVPSFSFYFSFYKVRGRVSGCFP